MIKDCQRGYFLVETIISLIDEYDKTISNVSNMFDYFNDAYLVFSGDNLMLQEEVSYDENAIEVIKAYFEGRIDKLNIIDNQYPYKDRKTRKKRHKGFCGNYCEDCNNNKCLGRK